MLPQKFRSLSVIFKLLLMLPTIKFNHDLSLDTGKVRNVLPYWVLATKSAPIELFPSQCLPKQAFNICHRAA